jgi:O-antigen/teichoic acid export membrane protein
MASVAASVVVARLVGAEGKGAFSLFQATVAGLVLTSTFGIGHGQMFHAARDPSQARHFMPNAFRHALFVGGTSALLWLGLAWLFDMKLTRLLDGSALAAGVLAVPVMMLLGFQRQYLLSVGAYRLSKTNLALSQIFPLVALVGLWTLGRDDVTTLILAFVASQLACCVAFQVVIRRQPGDGARPSLPLARASLRFGIRQYLSDLMQYLTSRIDYFLVASILGAASLGRYSVAVALAEMTLRLPSELGTILFPLFAGHDGAARAGAVTLLRRTLLVAVVVAGVLALVAPVVVRLLFGPQFDAAIPAFRWLLGGTVAWSTIFVTWNHASASGRPQLGIPIFGAAAALDVALNLVLLPQLGIVGASIASTVSYALAAALFLRIFCRAERCSLGEACLAGPEDVVELVAALGRMTAGLRKIVRRPLAGRA